MVEPCDDEPDDEVLPVPADEVMLEIVDDLVVLAGFAYCDDVVETPADLIFVGKETP